MDVVKCLMQTYFTDILKSKDRSIVDTNDLDNIKAEPSTRLAGGPGCLRSARFTGRIANCARFVVAVPVAVTFTVAVTLSPLFWAWRTLRLALRRYAAER